ncbi:MAG TPA: hypothetical protein VGL21_10840, partial [Jatrophihabitantaceae bacterium]
MRAVVYDEFGTPPVVREVRPPGCPPDGVVVRVRATGLCRSDWHGWVGHDPAGWSPAASAWTRRPPSWPRWAPP